MTADDDAAKQKYWERYPRGGCRGASWGSKGAMRRWGKHGAADRCLRDSDSVGGIPMKMIIFLSLQWESRMPEIMIGWVKNFATSWMYLAPLMTFTGMWKKHLAPCLVSHQKFGLFLSFCVIFGPLETTWKKMRVVLHTQVTRNNTFRPP